MEVESHKQLLDKEYETLLQQFSKELEKLQLRHVQELERKLKQNQNAEKKLQKEISSRQEADRKALETQQKRDYKVNRLIDRLIRLILLIPHLPRRTKNGGRGNCHRTRSHRNDNETRHFRVTKIVLDKWRHRRNKDSLEVSGSISILRFGNFVEKNYSYFTVSSRSC